MRTFVRIASVVAVVVTVWLRSAPAQETRLLSPQDVIRRERLISSLSPDGKSLMYLRLSPFVHPGPRLFVVDLVGGEERELTRQIDPRARIIAWTWSPSGRRIAVAGAIGPETTVWYTDRDSGQLKRIPHRSFRTAAAPALVWASEDELILSTLSDDAIDTLVQAEDLTIRQWAKANEGLEPSRSIVETGGKGFALSGRMGFWMLVNLRGGAATSVPDGGIPTRTVAGHTGKAIASLFRQSSPRLDRPGLFPDLRFSMDGQGLAVVKAEKGSLVARRVEAVVDVIGDSLSWSPDDGKLAFFARLCDGWTGPVRVRLRRTR